MSTFITFIVSHIATFALVAMSGTDGAVNVPMWVAFAPAVLWWVLFAGKFILGILLLSFGLIIVLVLEGPKAVLRTIKEAGSKVKEGFKEGVAEAKAEKDNS